MNKQSIFIFGWLGLLAWVLFSKPKHREYLIGGLGDYRDDSEFDPYDLEMGDAVELEHTDDPEIAKEIAKDHLTEDPNYYRKLQTMENPPASLCIWKALVRYKDGAVIKTGNFMIDASSMAQANDKAITFINSRFPKTTIESLHIGKYSC